MDLNELFANVLEKLKKTASFALTKSLEILNLTIKGIVALLSALKVKLDETLEGRKEPDDA